MSAAELRDVLTGLDVVIFALSLGFALTRRWGAAFLAFVLLLLLSVALLASGTMS